MFLLHKLTFPLAVGAEGKEDGLVSNFISRAKAQDIKKTKENVASSRGNKKHHDLFLYYI